MQWDFWTLSPESAHQVTYLMGDRGIPSTWRHMNLYGSHTYMWINACGEKFWVKYHFITDQGLQNLTQAQADELVKLDTDHHTRDLFEAIDRGEHPSWTLKMQIMPFDEAKTYRFNPFDLTKVWPHADYPLIEVGTLTLDRNPTDHHSQIEQGAWEPSNMVPGIGASPDKMLLGRMFAYADAHRYRIGANYNQLPVNAPHAPVHCASTAGTCATGWRPTRYAPNPKGGRWPTPPLRRARGLAHRCDSTHRLHAPRTTTGPSRHPGARVDEAERDRLVDNVVGHLRAGVSEPVLQRAFDYWRNIDRDLGDRSKKVSDSEPPPSPGHGSAANHVR
jgi:catalase